MRTLGRTTLTVSPVTLGTSSLGRADEAGTETSAASGETPGTDQVQLAAALLAGPHLVVDTSNNYTQGRSETILGRAIAEHGVPEGHAVVTKADADPDTGRFDRDRVWRSFEESMARLGLERLPLYHLHDPYTITVEEAFARGGAVQGMVELREQGLVDAIGVAAGSVELMSRYVAGDVFDALLTHNRYTLVDRRAEHLIEDAAARGMGVFNAAPFGGGLLAGHGTRYGYTESPPELLAWVADLRALCERRGVPVLAVALHFSLRNPLIDSTVVGVSRPERMAQLEDLRTVDVPDDLWSDVEALGTPPSPLTD